jgi:putative membrane protein insertion efficiency factor
MRDTKDNMMMRRLPLDLITLYQRWISPLLPPACRFEPSCSQYAWEAIHRHGLLAGAWMAILRLLKCHPFHPGGFDPVR